MDLGWRLRGRGKTDRTSRHQACRLERCPEEDFTHVKGMRFGSKAGGACGRGRVWFHDLEHSPLLTKPGLSLHGCSCPDGCPPQPGFNNGASPGGLETLDLGTCELEIQEHRNIQVRTDYIVNEPIKKSFLSTELRDPGAGRGARMSTSLPSRGIPQLQHCLLGSPLCRQRTEGTDSFGNSPPPAWSAAESTISRPLCFRLSVATSDAPSSRLLHRPRTLRDLFMSERQS